jgi:hypothetical protein
VRTSNPTKKVPAFHGTSEFITVFAKVWLRPCVTFHNMLFFFYSGESLDLTQPPSWKTTPCRLSMTDHSIYSQLPSKSGGLLLRVLIFENWHFMIQKESLFFEAIHNYQPTQFATSGNYSWIIPDCCLTVMGFWLLKFMINQYTPKFTKKLYPS